MLLWNLRLLFESPFSFIAVLIMVGVSLLLAISFHEASHAFMARMLGDRTGERMGRLTLNPFAHLDPLGTIMLFLVGFGWGKPVPVNPYLLRIDPKMGMGIVAFAGPAANLFLAFLFSLPIRFGFLPWHPPTRFIPHLGEGALGLAADLLGCIILYNILLASFNLIPIPPLDGFKILQGISPRPLSNFLVAMERMGPFILLIFLVLSYITGLLWYILGALMNFFAFKFVGQGF